MMCLSSGGFRFRRFPSLVLAITLAMLNLLGAEPASGVPGETKAGWRQLPIPFSTEEQILDFLNSARIVSRERLEAGINRPLRVELERDGIRLRAVFRDVDRDIPSARIHQVVRVNARDRGIFEVAAYELSRMLELDLVPPTILRRVGGRRGSLQLWIEGALTLSERIEKKLAPSRPVEWVREMSLCWFFDSLVHNDDRNQGNSLIDANGNLWLIDHTLCFYPSRELLNPDRLLHIETRVWKHLKEIPPDQVRQRLRSTLTRKEVDGLMSRWALLVDLFSELIESRGEELVLFTLDRQPQP